MIDSIAKVVDTIVKEYPEIFVVHGNDENISFLKYVVEHALLLLFSPRSLRAIYWLFVNDEKTVDEERELSADETQTAHMHITHALNQLCPDKSAPNPTGQKLFLMYFSDFSISNW